MTIKNRELIEQVAEAWASIDGNLDALVADRNSLDGSEDDTGVYEGYIVETEELFTRSGLDDKITELKSALIVAVIPLYGLRMVGYGKYGFGPDLIECIEDGIGIIEETIGAKNAN
jgi:hypothetical protein